MIIGKSFYLLNENALIQEYLVDLLGGLFPGILFILAFMFSLFPPLFIIASYFDSSGITIFDFINSFLTSVQQTPSAIWIVTFLLFLLLAYVIGHIFYRQDPKIPDRNGFLRLRKIKKRKLVNEFLQQNKKYKIPFINHVFYILKRLLFSIKISKTPKFKDELKKRLKEDYGCTSYDDCEFPYPFYLNYLNKRGLKHLKELAIWSNKGSFKRSKTFINILKIRLKFYFPDKYGTITRNEAHVRLASSTWYVSRISFFIGLFGFVISIILCYFQNDSKLDANIMKVSSKNLASLISPLIIILSSGYLKHNISKFIHYQRLREVFYVLETSFTTFRNEKFMQIIDPPFNLK